MDIKKLIYDNGTIKIDYDTDDGSYKLSVNAIGDNAPSADLTQAVARLISIYASRLDMEDRRSALRVRGIETGSDDDGEWFRIHGVYTAHNISHKLTTAKMREMQVPAGDGQYVDDYIEKKSAEYPSLLAPDEYDLFVAVIAEGQEFVNGKRLQQTLDFGEGDK